MGRLLVLYDQSPMISVTLASHFLLLASCFLLLELKLHCPYLLCAGLMNKSALNICSESAIMPTPLEV